MRREDLPEHRVRAPEQTRVDREACLLIATEILRAVIRPPECQAPVALQAMPAQVGGLEPFAGHRLHGISEYPLYLPDLYEHVVLTRRLPWLLDS